MSLRRERYGLKADGIHQRMTKLIDGSDRVSTSQVPKCDRFKIAATSIVPNSCEALALFIPIPCNISVYDGELLANKGEKTIAVLQNQSSLNGFAESMAAQSPIRLAAIKRLTLLLRQ